MPLAERLVKAYVVPALADRKFERLGRSSVWIREAAELRHLLTMNVSRNSVRVQWGVADEAVLSTLWPRVPQNAGQDVAHSAMTGWLTSVPGTKCPVAVELPDASDQSDGILPALSDDLATAADWMAQFAQRRDLVRYLLAVDEPKDRRGFLVPANLPLKLTTCAFLLDLDGEPEARALASRAVAALEGFRASDPLAAHRLTGLRQVIAHQERRRL